MGASKDFDALIEVLIHIEWNIDNPIDLEDQISKLGFNIEEFEKVFQDKIGTNTTEYIHQRRITQALKCLATTNDAAADIAGKYQFQDIETLTSCLMKMYGLNPFRIRKGFSLKLCINSFM